MFDLTKFIITSFILGLIYFYWYVKKQLTFWSSRGIDGPPPIFLLGNSLEIFTNTRVDTNMKWFKKYGRIVGFYQGLQPMLLISDADVVKQILVKDFHHFMNRQKLNFYHTMWNDNLFNADSEAWKRIRTITSPAFTSGKLRGMQRLMIDCVDKLEQHLDSVILDQNGMIKDMKGVFAGFSIDVIASTSFATETNSNSLDGQKSPFVVNGKLLFDVNRLRAFIAFSCPKWINSLCRIDTFLPSKPFNFFIDLAREIVKQRKQEGTKRNDLVQLLMDSYVDEQQLKNISYEKLSVDVDKDDQIIETTEKFSSITKNYLSETEIIAQSFLFFIAGFDTTSSTICYILYELSRNSQIQERLCKCLNEATSNLDPTSEQFFEVVVNQIPYLEAVIKESVRMYPQATVLFRRVTTDNYELNGVPLPKDLMVEISTHTVHHDPEYYPNPEQFNPDRFMPENKHLLVPYTYLTFGAGPRNCVGMRFAYQEIKLLLSKLLIKYRFETVKDTPDRIIFNPAAPILIFKSFPLKITKR